MTTDPFAGKSEITSDEYNAWRDAGSPTALIPPAEEGAPDWRTTEKKFMARVVAFATEHDWTIYHTYRSASSNPGFPDLVMARGRCLVFAELKVRPNKPTAMQRQWLEALDLAGAETYVWHPDQWDAIEEVLG